MLRKICLFLCCLAACFHPLAGYENCPYIPSGLWNDVQPYLLPENHPAKAALDKIFKKSRATASLIAMRKAGFKFENPRTLNRLVAAKHSSIKGYLVKAFTDEQTMVSNEGYHWIQRINGARIIQESIDRHGCNWFMKVPKKWIYPLPTILPLLKAMRIANILSSSSKI